MSSLPCVTDLLEKVQPYEDARSLPLSHPGKKSFLKLDCNEAPYGPSPHVRTRLMDFIENASLNWYPDPQSQDLKEALCLYVGYPPEYVSTFNGCDHALDSICRTYLKSGDEVIVLSPTYDNFRLFVELTGATIVPYFASSPFQAEVEGLEKLITCRTKIVYLANPNNPTGITYTVEQIQSILRATGALVIVDEAYFEFWGKTSLSLIKDFPNLVITRSFSKAFGLAGLRCGYLVTDPRNVKKIEKVRNGKNINVLAQLAASVALKDLNYIKEQIERMHKTKEWFANSLRAKGMYVVNTVANFILLKVNKPDQAENIFSINNVLIRNRSHFPKLEGYLRITIGTKEEMQRFLKIASLIPPEYIHLPQFCYPPKKIATG